MWSGSPATESIQAGLETAESLKTPVDDDIDSLERAYKQNNDLQIGEKDNFTIKLLLWSLQILLPLLVIQFNKIYHRHVHLLNKLLVEAIINAKRINFL